MRRGRRRGYHAARTATARRQRSQRGRRRTSADAPGTTPPSGAVELDVEYHVPGATWSPVYRLRLGGGSGAGSLVLRACVAQRTGEDWTGVRLGLSTADLVRRADLPELRSLRIGRSQAEPGTPSWREPPPGLDELFAGYDAAARRPRPPPCPRPWARRRPPWRQSAGPASRADRGRTPPAPDAGGRSAPGTAAL